MIVLAGNQAAIRDVCLNVPENMRRRLLAAPGSVTRPDGTHQYWVDAELSDRLGPAQCGKLGNIAISRGLDRVNAASAVACAKNVFVANGFSCPAVGKSRRRSDATYGSLQDYYPLTSLRAGKQGRTVVRVDRDSTGSPTHCTILQSSGDSDLDEQTCKLVGVDPNFTPDNSDAVALDRPIIQSVRWRLPDD